MSISNIHMYIYYIKKREREKKKDTKRKTESEKYLDMVNVIVSKLQYVQY